MGVPKLFGVSAEASKAAEDALSFNLKVPEAPWPVAENTTSKGVRQVRWAETATIDGAWLEESGKGYTGFCVKAKLRTGNPNAGRSLWGRHYLDFDTFGAGEAGADGLIIMNNMTIKTLNQLLGAVDMKSDNGALDVGTLQMLFPIGKEAASTSPLKGKQIVLNIVEAPDNRPTAKPGDRSCSVEGYNPA